MGNSNISQRGFSARYFGFLNATRQYFRFLASQSVALPNYGTLLTWDNFIRYLSPRPTSAVMIQPLNLAAYYPNDSTAIRLDGSNNVILWEDRSGNSPTNILALDGNNSNYASFTALTAFGSGDFTAVADVFISVFAGASRIMIGGLSNSFSFFVNTSGFLQTAKDSVGNNTASTTQLAALTRYTLAYVRSGTVGTYYVNGVAAGTTTDSNNYSVGNNQIGASSGASLVFRGNIFTARLYNTALNATAVLNDYLGIIQSNCVFDTDFSSAAKLATSFTSGTRGGASALTITINTSGDTGARICGARDLYQGTAASRPAFTVAAGGNRAFMTFDGTDDYLKAASFNLSQPETVYFVGSQVTWANNRGIYDGNSNTQVMSLYQQTGTPRLTLFASSNGPTSTALPLGVRAIITAIFNGANSFMLFNRSFVGSGDVGASSAGGFVLAQNRLTTAAGNIIASEVAIYSEAHTSTIQNNIISYLASKYSIGL